MKTFEPFLRYCSAIRHKFSLKMTTRCLSVCSLRSPVVLSFQDSEVARRRFATGRPSWVRRISGSAPRLPIKITLLTLPAIELLRSFPISPIFAFQPSAGPARGKGDRRAMAVIHTASRRGAYPKLCSYFVLAPDARGTAKHRDAPLPPHRRTENGAVLSLGNTLSEVKSARHWSGG